jgi:hypothetical protein
MAEQYTDDHLLCKYGRSEDMSRRLGEHINKYRKEFNTNLQIIGYSLIDPKNIVNAENNISNYFENKKIKYKDERELVVIEKNYVDFVREQFKMLQKEYSGHCKQLIEKIQELEHQNKELTHTIELQQSKYENKLKDKDLEIQMIKNNMQSKEIELLKKELALHCCSR